MTNKVIYKYALTHAHPAKFIAEILGTMWAAYFLWNYNWVGAIISALVFYLLSTLILWGKSIDYLAETPLGKVMLVYSTPIAAGLKELSIVPLIYGLWTHNPIYILIGISMLFLPHFWRW